MPRIAKIAIAAVGLIGVGVIAMKVSFEGSQAALEDEYPDVDPTIVRRVHTKMFWDALKGKHDFDPTDDELNEMFLGEVAKETA